MSKINYLENTQPVPDPDMSPSLSVSASAMVDEAGTFEALDIPQRLVVWGCRTWVAGCRQQRCTMDDVRAVFSRFAVIDAAASLDALLGAAAQYAIRPIQVRCPVCAQISDDEVILLHAAAAAQHRDLPAARGHLEHWLPAALADWALGPLCGLGALFEHAGLILPVRSESKQGLPLRGSKRCHLH